MVFRRKGGSTAEAQNRAKEIGHELTESVDHLKQAAVAAREALSPTLSSAREVTESRYDAAKSASRPSWEAMVASMAPMLAAASDIQNSGRKAARKSSKEIRSVSKEAKRQAAKMSGQRRRRWPWVVGGALAIGGALGVASALMRKRSSRSEWEEYGSGSSRSTGGTIKTQAGLAQEKLSDTASTLKDKVTSAAGGSERGGHAGDHSKGYSEQSGDATRRTVDTGTGSPNPGTGVGQGAAGYSRPN